MGRARTAIWKVQIMPDKSCALDLHPGDRNRPGSAVHGRLLEMQTKRLTAAFVEKLARCVAGIPSSDSRIFIFSRVLFSTARCVHVEAVNGWAGREIVSNPGGPWWGPPRTLFICDPCGPLWPPFPHGMAGLNGGRPKRGAAPYRGAGRPKKLQNASDPHAVWGGKVDHRGRKFVRVRGGPPPRMPLSPWAVMVF